MDNMKEQFVTTLILPEEYSHHLNEVSGVTTKSILYLKRKFISSVGSEIVKYDIADCSSIEIVDERPLHILILGVLLSSLILFIFYCIYLYWADLESGKKIYIGLFGLALFYGFTWIFGARRHRIIFTMSNGKKLKWKSSSGDFHVKAKNVECVRELAKQKEIYITSG